ncbi:acyltransferase [Sphingomonas sp. VNH70]|uniref:acyltransferase family protein n=1 Tax=Sphingomonas silueang TaxID=3156617 RepID=UPI0032B52117
MRHQYANLDALRGVAAGAVLLYHAHDWFGTRVWFGHGYMAVDFFFVLSGFVIAFAYEQRLAQTGSLARFVRDRIVRLYPMIVAGAALGAVAFVARARSNGIAIDGGATAAIVAAAVPWPVTWTGGDPWPVNPPIWSIFWELAVNLLFALTVRWWTTRIVAAVVLVTMLALAVLSWRMGGFVHMGPMADGWALGGLRTLGGFGLGVLTLRLHRQGIGAGTGRRWWVVAALLLATTVLPGGTGVARWLDPLLAALVFPAIVLAAAGSASLGHRFARIGGDLSYPVYAVHMPLLLLFAGLWTRLGLKGGVWQPVGGVAMLVAVIAAAWIAHRFWDVPLRARLKRRSG